MVVRETVSSYTLTEITDSERHDCLQDSILSLCAKVKSLGDGGAHIRVDPAPGLQALTNDPLFSQHGIILEMGNANIVNKTPVVEVAIKELGL